MLKAIKEEEFLASSRKGPMDPIIKELLNMKVGACALLSVKNWKYKSNPTSVLYHWRYTGQKYNCRMSTDMKAFLIKRVA